MGNRKLPFGYKMVMGEIVIHPQEAQAVQGIYARYLAGASFNDKIGRASCRERV